MTTPAQDGRWVHIAGVAIVAGAGFLAVALSAIEGESPRGSVSAATSNQQTPAVYLAGLAFDGTPEPLPTPTPSPEPTIPPKASSLAGLRVWSDGDSTSYFMTVSLFGITGEQGGTAVKAADYKISSGLQNTVFFDWRGYIASEMALYDPDVAVFMVGANDALQIRSYEDYGARVGAIMDLMYRPGRKVIWMGQPNMRPDPSQGYSPALAAAIPPLNDVFRAQAATRSWVTFVDTFALTSYSEGSFADALPDENGVLQPLRAGDGIHFTPAGGRRLALAAVEAILR
ncbi:MAG: GDSL-type esterase/lipase family protein [bacterium]